MAEHDGEELGVKARELARVFGNYEANDQCLRDFLRYLNTTSANKGTPFNLSMSSGESISRYTLLHSQ